MNLVWHIVWKDARRLRWPLAAWAGLIVVQWLVGLWMVARAGFDLQLAQRLAALHPLLLGAQLISAYLMVAWLVHEDPVIGIRSHWMTLPISGGRLVAAKFTALALFFWILPCVLSLPWWLACGFGLREIGWAALQMAALHAAVTLPAWPVAVFTDSWARFLTWTLVLVVTVLTLGCVLAALNKASDLTTAPVILAVTRPWLAVAIWIVAIPVVCVQQYRTRRIGRSVGWGIASFAPVLVMALVTPVFPMSWLSFNMASKPRVLSNAVHIDPSSDALQASVSFPEAGTDRLAPLSFTLRGTVENLAANEFLWGLELKAEFRWADGVSFRQNMGSWDGGNEMIFLKSRQPTDAAGGARAHRWHVYRHDLLPSLAMKMLKDPPTLHAQANIGVDRGEIVGELPLTVGARFSNEAQTVRIAERSWFRRKGRNDEQLRLTVVETRRHEISEALPFKTKQDRYAERLRQDPFIVVNRTDLDYSEFNYSPGGSYVFKRPFSAVISGVEINWRQLEVWPASVRKKEWRGVPYIELRRKYNLKNFMDAHEPSDPHWFDGAKLLSVRFTPVGRIETAFTIERFETMEERRQGAP